jgi:heat shock protein HspQ
LESRARFAPGELIQHSRFDYRGVIVDVDPVFELDDEWYERVARSRPPKDKPWYHVLVHDTDQITYVAERHLERDASEQPIRHPLLDHFFERFRSGHYTRRGAVN